MIGHVLPSQLNLALEALIGLARHRGTGLITAHQLAAAEGIPEPSLRKVLPFLSRAGLVQSERGMRGGHRISRDPDNISILDVCDALDMNWSKDFCVFGTFCGRDPRKCPTVNELARVTGKLRHVLGRHTISMCSRPRPRARPSIK